MEVEPGTYLVANAGYLVTSVMDRKRTGADGFDFVLTDGGMEVNTRPLLYGSEHPFYVTRRNGKLLSSEFSHSPDSEAHELVIVGRCCESGDSLTLDESGLIKPRRMAAPDPGDLVIVGGCGAYCSTMSPFNYNSHVQCPEVLAGEKGELRLVRTKEHIPDLWRNEIGLD